MVFGFGKKSSSKQPTTVDEAGREAPYDEAPPKPSLLPVFACGAGLYSDGYVNNVIGSVSTLLGKVSPVTSLRYHQGTRDSSSLIEPH